jgi:hypothetical protein
MSSEGKKPQYPRITGHLQGRKQQQKQQRRDYSAVLDPPRHDEQG